MASILTDAQKKLVVARYTGPDKPTMDAVAAEFGCSFKVVFTTISRSLTPEQRKQEKILRYSRSKDGYRNPMHRKFGALHHNFKGAAADGKGYLTIVTPSWMVQGPKRVFQHHAVMCEALGLQQIPDGFHVHHISGDRTDNRLSNLALVSAGAHVALHHPIPLSDALSLWELHQFTIWKSQQTTAS